MKSLFHNPRYSSKALLAAGAALLLAVLALGQLLWGWVERSQPRLSGGSNIKMLQVAAALLPSPLMFLQDEQVQKGPLTNLFNSPYVERVLLKQAEQKAQLGALQNMLREKSLRESARPKASNEVATVKDQVKSKPPPPVQVSFQGVIGTADGVMLAMIGVGTVGSSCSCAVGEKFRGAIASKMNAGSVELILNDGSVRVVARGKPEMIPEALLNER
jgi:hypothetical protein